jgi:hypothetical protein
MSGKFSSASFQRISAVLLKRGSLAFIVIDIRSLRQEYVLNRGQDHGCHYPAPNQEVPPKRTVLNGRVSAMVGSWPMPNTRFVTQFEDLNLSPAALHRNVFLLSRILY